ncbi:acyl-CoA reductase [Pseudaeromonas sharmana]|uniref:long-chain-fatty-acyl-CoA reductase n=1 Tax=Pseudaeromonas sharmana TaxID=328412 RepID=A0ABV8CJJ8_9GAMM
MQRHIPVTGWPEQGIEFVLPTSGWHGFTTPPLAVADPCVVAFCHVLSQRLLSLGRAWPDLMALGFWLRPAALQAHLPAYAARSPLGLTLHLVPSNVPTLGVFSWLMALLAGNSAIVRLSRRQDAVQQQLLAVCADLLARPEWQPIADRVRFIRYGHDEAITAALSARCDLRVVWGGDATVNAIRAIPLPPRARELVFPDRRSLAVLDAAGWRALDEAGRQRQMTALAQDISQFNQQACASPTTLVWLGEWQGHERGELLAALAAPFAFAPANGMARLVNSQLALATAEAQTQTTAGTLSLLQAAALQPQVMVGGGVLLERHYPDMDAWLADGDQVQTCVCVGLSADAVAAVLRQYSATRIDRLVAPGQALAFDWFWDGQDLLASMSRQTRVG